MNGDPAMNPNVHINAIATKLPEDVFTTAQILDALPGEISPHLYSTIGGLGVSKRHSVICNFPEWLAEREPMHQSASCTQLASRAILDCIDSANLDTGEIGLVLALTNTQCRILPGLAAEIMAELHGVLPTDLSLVNMQGQGCSALLKGVEVCRWYLGQHPGKKAILVDAEVHTTLCPQLAAPAYLSFREIHRNALDAEERSRLMRRTEEFVQSLLFGDGAVAMVLSLDDTASRGCLGTIAHRTNLAAEDAELLVMPEGGSQHPHVCGRPRYYMQPGVPARGAAYAAITVEDVIARSNGGPASVADAVACLVHTGSRKILDGVCTQLGISPDAGKVSRSYDVLDRFGNLSSASIGFMLAEGGFAAGTGLIVSFGVGFSASAGAISFS
jgi:3-oxoacyl-[acyl-carrier-protein] synthase-3